MMFVRASLSVFRGKVCGFSHSRNSHFQKKIKSVFKNQKHGIPLPPSSRRPFSSEREWECEWGVRGVGGV